METKLVLFDGVYEPLIRDIRHRVFTGEQHIDTQLDFDGRDGEAVHAVAFWGDTPAGTGRMLDDGHIGRLAVLREYRGQGLGAAMVLALVKEAEKRGQKEVWLGAQKQAVGFYEKLGFSPYGTPYTEVQIEHMHMKKTL